MGGDERIADAQAASALSWWLEAGVDVAVQEQPRNWLEAKAEVSRSAEAPPAVQPVEPALPQNLDLFHDWLKDAPLPLAKKASGRVLPVGRAEAEIMLLFDPPTSEEAAAQQPLAGEAWALMQRMLAAIGFTADQAYCANISCFHAPGQRLTAAEIGECAALARRQIALAKPKRLLLLGEAPTRALLGKPLAAARGHADKIEGVRCVATFHPRFLLGRPSDKPRAWRDLLLLMEDEG